MYLGRRCRCYLNSDQVLFFERTLRSMNDLYQFLVRQSSSYPVGFQEVVASAHSVFDSLLPAPVFFKQVYQIALQDLQELKERKKRLFSFRVPLGRFLRADPSTRYLDLPFFGSVRVRGLKPFEGKVLSFCIRRYPDGHYGISLLLEPLVPVPPLPRTGKCVGLDLGFLHFVTTSDGDRLQIPAFFRESEESLRHLDRLLSTRVRGSRGYRKILRQRASLFREMKERRDSFLHLYSKSLVRNYDWIFAESLEIREMAQNRHHSRSVVHSGWGQFLKQLEYKCRFYGKTFHTVARSFPSSQLCFHCGYQNPETKDCRKRTITCPHCGRTYDRDLNAALNIREQGKREIGLS